MQTRKKLSSNMEDYLEAIAVLKKKNGVARVKDISRLLNVEPPSVASALNNLSGNGFVVHERYGYVELTPEGKRLAKDIKGRHDMLVRFLTEILSIDPKTAAEDACKMEHSMSAKTFEKLSKFTEFVGTCPDHNGPDRLRSFGYYIKTGRRRKCNVRQTNKRGVDMADAKVVRDLKPGEKGRITRVTGAGSVYRRLLDMGVVKGAEVEMERVAPLGDPVEVRIKGYRLSLRKEEAANICVEVN